MKIKEVGNKTTLNSSFIRIWISFFMSFMCGYTMFMVVMYFIDKELFADMYIISLISVLVITFLLAKIVIKFKKHNINAIWIRLLLCIFIPLILGFLLAVIFGNDWITVFVIKMNLDRIVEVISYSAFLISIVLGQIFIKPWRSGSNFILGTVYVAIYYFVLVIYQLILGGILYDNWL